MDPETTAPSKIAAGLLIAQKALEEVTKNAQNEYHDYAYTSADEMIRVSRKALHAGGLTVSMTGHDLEVLPEIQAIFTDDNIPPFIFLNAHFRLEHESGETRDYTFQLPAIPEKGRPLDKAILGCLTTCTGYFLRDLMQIPREDSNDVDKRNDNDVQAPRRAPTWQQKQAERNMDAPPPSGPQPSTKARLWGLIEKWAQPTDADARAKAGKHVYEFLKMATDGSAPEKDLCRGIIFVQEQLRKGVDFGGWITERIEKAEAEKALAAKPAPAPAPAPTTTTAAQASQLGTIADDDIPFAPQHNYT